VAKSSNGDERGKSPAAEKDVYGAIDRIGDQERQRRGEAIAVLQQRCDNVKPVSSQIPSRRRALSGAAVRSAAPNRP